MRRRLAFVFGVTLSCRSLIPGIPECGNGVMEAGELCDDANTTSGDGCRADCFGIELCGDGTLDGATEACDDFNPNDGDGCDSNCTLTSCGNGIVTAGELCDDGNVVNADTCEANCTLPACANGILDPGELCSSPNPSAFFLGDGPQDIAAGDIDADSFIDLITANENSENISVLFGDGQGNFPIVAEIDLRAAFPDVLDPSSIAVVDLNLDGRDDLAVAARGSNKIFLLGEAGFLTPIKEIKVGLGPEKVIAAELNGDNLPDLVVSNADDDTLSALINQGNNNFTERVLQAGDNPQGLIAIDIDNDNDTDIITANSDVNTLTLFFNAAIDPFNTSVTLTVGANPQSLAAGDIDGDSLLDIVTANLGSGDATIIFGDPNEQTGFAPPASLTTTGAPFNVAIADLNSDAALDIVTSNIGSNDINIFQGSNSRIFAAPIIIPTQAARPEGLVIAQIDEAGRLDIATANEDSDNISVLLEPGQNNVTRLVELGDRPESLAIGVINDQGIDIVTANAESNNVSIFFNTASNSFGVSFTANLECDVNDVTLADLDGDGINDLIIAADDDQLIKIVINSGNGTASSIQDVLTPGISPSSVRTADLDNDGDPDIFTANESSDSVTIVFNKSPNFSFIERAVGNQPNDLELGDFDEDGLIDLATSNKADNSVSVRLSKNNFGDNLNIDTGPTPVALEVADINQDNHLDIITLNQGDDTLSFLAGQGDGTFLPPPNIILPNGFFVSLKVADVDFDTFPDLLIGDILTGEVLLFINEQGGLFNPTPTRIFNTADEPTAIEFADVTGDSLPEIIVAGTGDDGIIFFLGQN